MKTYHLEYYYDFAPEKIETCYFTTDRVIKDGVIKSEQIHSIRITWQSELGYIITGNSTELYLRHRDDNPYQIHYKILKQDDVEFDENKYLTENLIAYLSLIEIGSILVERNPTTKEVQEYKALINSCDINLICDYFVSRIKLDFYQHILIKEPLEYLYNIVDNISKTLTYENIKRFDKLDFDLDYYSGKDDNKIKVYELIIKSIKRLSQVVSEVTTIFRFHYDYSPYVSLNYYLKRVQELLYTEIGLLPVEDVQKKIELDNELVRQRNILSELADYNNIDRLFNILYNVDVLYNFKELKKLDRCCIALLLIEHCPLFKNNVTKPFNKFRKLICEYYGTSDVSFKENDCKDRIEEVYNQQKGFWRYDTKKNPRKQHYLKR